jgi:3-hydroxy acid dehydrogenase / malonic semialdehyde reductase
MTKNILITGATSGFGKAIAYTFAKNGFGCILTGRRQDRLDEIENDLKSLTTAPIQTLCFDVRNKTEVVTALTKIDKTKFPTINILVNNAGLASGMSTIQDGNYDDWDAMIDTNIKGLLYVSRAIISLLEPNNSHIINIGSTAGKGVYPMGNVYCATKYAVDAISQAMRIDLLSQGIKVTSINPGAAETEFSIVRFKGDELKAKAIYDGFTPLNAQDIADTAWYVANLPKHVCINEINITCITQANAHYNIKKTI